MAKTTQKQPRKTEEEMIQEERNNRALALEVAVTTAKKAFGNEYSGLALDVYDRLAYDEDGAVLENQRELVEQLQQSVNIANTLGIAHGEGCEKIFGIYDRIFDQSAGEKLDEILEVVCGDDDE